MKDLKSFLRLTVNEQQKSKLQIGIPTDSSVAR
jgi:hypothetical protein